jgi:uncharacterized protein (TIGR02453 family)
MENNTIALDKSVLAFLKELSLNNNREWFNANRGRYEASRKNFELFIQALIDRIVSFDPILKGLEAKSCMFRINRDTRFSKDKSVYKTNFGAFIVRGGKQNGDRFAGYYIHLEPGECMIAGGAYMPPAEWLNAIREKINAAPDDFLSIINDKAFIKNFGALSGEKLKTAPKGYPRDHPHIELLKHKSYIAVKELSDKEVRDTGFLDSATETCRAMKDFNEFLSGYQD